MREYVKLTMGDLLQDNALRFGAQPAYKVALRDLRKTLMADA